MNDNQQIFKYIAIGLIGILFFSLVAQSPALLMFVLAGFFAYKWYSLSETTKEIQRRHDIYKSKAVEYEEKYRDLIDVDTAIKTSQSEYSILQEKIRKEKEDSDLLQSTLTRYRKKLADYKEQFNLIDFGFYEPHFSFEHSETYKEKMVQVRDKQKEMLKNSLAIKSTSQILVDGNQQKGKAFTDKIVKLTGRAFKLLKP